MNMEKTAKYKTIKWHDRLQIEALYRAGHSPKDIANQLGFHYSSIYREIKRGNR